MPTHTDIVLYFIFAGAAILHGVTGLGITLITTAALASRFDYTHVIILTLFPTLILNSMTWLIGGGSIWHNLSFYLKKYWLIAFMGIIGSYIGASLILLLNPAYLLLMLSGVLAFYIISTLTGNKIVMPNTTPALIFVGIAAGIIGGATNAMSSVLLMYLLSITEDRHTIAKVGNMCYLFSKLTQLIVLKDSVLAMSYTDWQLVSGLSVVSVVFLLLGIRLRDSLSQHRFKQLIFIILAILCVKVGWQGWVSLSAS